MTFLWVLLILIAVVLLAGYIVEQGRRPIRAADRKGAPGQFAQLSQGTTHYRWHGAARGPVLVAIHGLTTPSVVWDVIAPGLGAMGYRVLTYDLYGRGLSDAPSGPQDRAFFLRQLDDLLAHEELEEDITLLGYSMGGSIATAFTQEQTHRVKRLILLATAGVETRESGFSGFCRKTPVIGDFVHNLLGGARMRAALLAAQAQSEVPGAKQSQLDQLKRRGYLQAVLSSRRGMLDETQEPAHRLIGKADVPTIAIWAEQDDVIPLSALGKMAQWNRNARQETIPDAGHDVAHTHASAVLDTLAEIVVETD